MTIQIRKMTGEDVPAVDRLMQEGHRLHVSGRPDIYRPMAHPIPLEELSAMACDPSVCILLAEVGGAAAGMCMLLQKPPSSNPLAVPRAVTHMDVLCVEEQYQGQGIGRLLFESAKKQAEAWGSESLELKVWSFNQRAIDFYQHLGMHPQQLLLETPIKCEGEKTNEQRV